MFPFKFSRNRIIVYVLALVKVKYLSSFYVFSIDACQWFCHVNSVPLDLPDSLGPKCLYIPHKRPQAIRRECWGETGSEEALELETRVAKRDILLAQQSREWGPPTPNWISVSRLLCMRQIAKRCKQVPEICSRYCKLQNNGTEGLCFRL